MRFLLIADAFPPMRTSAAVQLKDLALELVSQGYEVCVLLPGYEQSEPRFLEMFQGVTVVRLRSPYTKSSNYLRRIMAEFFMPFFMLWNFSNSPNAKSNWDGIIWYSPSIFFGPVVSHLKRRSNCKSYLIIRDIFPEWALDIGIINRGLAFYFLRLVARYQYSLADTIGVQSIGNTSYFTNWSKAPNRKLEVLPNWLGNSENVRCSIRLDNTKLAGRKTFVYAGNMGVAQGMGSIITLMANFKDDEHVGFVFVGRGSALPTIKGKVTELKMHPSVIFLDEVPPDELDDLLSQCSIGVIALDHRHKSQNIPGKFLTYVRCGLPVLANTNPNSDLGKMIRNEQIGEVCENNDDDELFLKAKRLLSQIDTDTQIPVKCADLFKRAFSAEKTAKQVVAALGRS